MLQREKSLHVIINVSIRAKDEIEGWGPFGDINGASAGSQECILKSNHILYNAMNIPPPSPPPSHGWTTSYLGWGGDTHLGDIKKIL